MASPVTAVADASFLIGVSVIGQWETSNFANQGASANVLVHFPSEHGCRPFHR